MIKILNLVASLLAATSIVSAVANGVASKNAIPITRSKTLPSEGIYKISNFDWNKDVYVDISFTYEGLLSIAHASHFHSSNWFYNFFTDYEGFDSGKLSWWAEEGSHLQFIIKHFYGESGLDALQDAINGSGTYSSAQGWPSLSQNHIYYYDQFIFNDFRKILFQNLNNKNGLFWTLHFHNVTGNFPDLATSYFPILKNPPTPKFNQASYKRGASKRTSSRDIDIYKYYANNAFNTPELPTVHTYGYTLDLSWASVRYLVDAYDKLYAQFPASMKWKAAGGFISYLMDQPYIEYHTSYSDGWDLSSYINADADIHERGHFIPDVVYSYLGQRNPESIANKMWTIVKNAWDSFETININIYSDFLFNNSVITWFSLENPYNHQICVSNAI